MNILKEATVSNKIVIKDYSPKFKDLANDTEVCNLVKKLQHDVANYEEDLIKSIGDKLAEKL